MSDEDENPATRRQKQLERAKKRALHSSVMEELRDEYLDTPTEVSHGNQLRANISKHQRHKNQWVPTSDTLSMIWYQYFLEWCWRSFVRSFIIWHSRGHQYFHFSRGNQAGFKSLSVMRKLVVRIDFDPDSQKKWFTFFPTSYSHPYFKSKINSSDLVFFLRIDSNLNFFFILCFY